MTLKKPDWRAEFRLHAMDLDRQSAAQQHEPHWILSDRWFRSLIADIEEAWRQLGAWGGDPFPGHEVSAQAVLDKLHYAERQLPRGLLADVKFTTQFVIACMRETLEVHAQISHLRHLTRPRARHL